MRSKVIKGVWGLSVLGLCILSMGCARFTPAELAHIEDHYVQAAALPIKYKAGQYGPVNDLLLETLKANGEQAKIIHQITEGKSVHEQEK